MKKLIIGASLILGCMLLVYAAAPKQTGIAEDRRQDQKERADRHLQEFYRIATGMAYSDGYRDGYIQAAMDCAQYKGKPLEKKKVAR